MKGYMVVIAVGEPKRFGPKVGWDAVFATRAEALACAARARKNDGWFHAYPVDTQDAGGYIQGMATQMTETTGPQMQWHRKPNGGLCDVCGCGGKLRKGVEHRALTAEEAISRRGAYIKRISDAYGRDTLQWALDVDGKPLHQGVEGLP